MSSLAKGKMFSGARAVFSLSGVQVGFATSVSVGESIDYQPVETLDNIEVDEYVPVGYRVTFSAAQFRIVGSTLKSQGWFPKVGNNTNDHLSNILTNGDLTATIEDRTTGTILATLEQVKVTDHNWTVNARGIVGEDVNFVAIRLKDESET